MIPAHRVNGDSDHSALQKKYSLFGDFDYLATFVLAAMSANAVGQFRFVAVRALGEAGFPEGVVGFPVRGQKFYASSSAF